jgi:uncharacterized protein
MVTRRKFIKRTAVISLAGILSHWAINAIGRDRLGDVLPLRQITRNGEKSTAFSLGGYHAAKSLNPSQAEKLIERSVELGVRFFDNARGYHQGTAEEYYGKFLTPKYRDEVFLMTKSHGRSKADVQKHLDESLNAMKTDYLDLWTIHTISTIEDVDNRINQGVLDYFLEAKAKGKTRYIGFSCHTNPKVALYFMDFLDKRGLELDTCQCPVNVCDPSFESFQKQVMPVLLEKEYGIIAMKSMAGGGIIGRRFDLTSKDIRDDQIKDISKETTITRDQLHRFVYSQPVSTLCSGCETIAELEHNVGILKNLQKLSDADILELTELAQPFAGLFAEHYKRIL